MMSVYELTDGGGLRPTGSAEFPVTGVNDGILRWARLIGPQHHELQDWLRTMELPDAVSEILYEDDIESRVATYGRTLLMALLVLAPGAESVLRLRVICTPTMLITLEGDALPAIDRLVTERRSVAQAGMTLPSLFIEVIEAAASSVGQVYLSLRRKLDELGDVIENKSLEVPPDTLLVMKQQVAQLSALLGDQIHGFMEVQRRHSHLPPSDGSRDLLRDLVSNAGWAQKLLTQMESRLRDLRQHQLHCLQESTNRRLNMLAILSAIYMPATLIAGIYGMNFEHIPVIQLRYGYFIVISIMVALVGGQLWYFHRRGWFK